MLHGGPDEGTIDGGTVMRSMVRRRTFVATTLGVGAVVTMSGAIPALGERDRLGAGQLEMLVRVRDVLIASALGGTALTGPARVHLDRTPGSLERRLRELSAPRRERVVTTATWLCEHASTADPDEFTTDMRALHADGRLASVSDELTETASVLIGSSATRFGPDRSAIGELWLAGLVVTPRGRDA